VNQKLWHGRITDEELVDMVTINPAVEFGMDKEIGSLEVGKFADYLIIAKSSAAPTAYRALIDARPADVLLVAISGDPLFGKPAFMDSLGKQGDYELVDACGQQRAIDVTVNASDVTNGTETFSSIEGKLQSVNPKLTPLVDCTNDAEIAALTGSVVPM
jgi:adenine deaminase